MQTAAKLALRVSWVSLIVNLLLSAGKLLAGVLAHSGAMVSDAVHSLSDVCSTVVVMIGVRASSKAEDAEHPYGHERMECVAAIVLADLLLLTGLGIGYGGVKAILVGAGELAVPGVAALIAAGVSIVVKEGMFRYTAHYARQLRSGALMADAWHHRSDALSSVGALIGIVGARLGLRVLDPVASVVICVMIVKAAVEIFIDAVKKMVDHSCDAETEARLLACAMEVPDVERVDVLRTREFGNRFYVEMEIAGDSALPLSQAHAIAERVHDSIEAGFPEVKHVVIHENPA
jgi:cation diffusion facilitator family transporter